MCTLKRSNHEFLNKLFPTYYLCLNSNNMFLLNARKKTFIKSSNYHISTKIDDFDENDRNGNKIADLRSDFLGLTWNLVSGYYTKGFANDIDNQKNKENKENEKEKDLRKNNKDNNIEIKVEKEKLVKERVRDIYATILYVLYLYLV